MPERRKASLEPETAETRPRVIQWGTLGAAGSFDSTSVTFDSTSETWDQS